MHACMHRAWHSTYIRDGVRSSHTPHARLAHSLAPSRAQLTTTRLPHLHFDAVELADLPFARQIPLFRAAAIFTGMHGAGYANIIFMPPGGVVAELCPLGYCTKSFERLSSRVGLTYLRWTNSISANAREDYNTIVDPPQFIALMQRALKALGTTWSALARPEHEE